MDQTVEEQGGSRLLGQLRFPRECLKRQEVSRHQYPHALDGSKQQRLPVQQMGHLQAMEGQGRHGSEGREGHTRCLLGGAIL